MAKTVKVSMSISSDINMQDAMFMSASTTIEAPTLLLGQSYGRIFHKDPENVVKVTLKQNKSGLSIKIATEKLKT